MKGKVGVLTLVFVFTSGLLLLTPINGVCANKNEVIELRFAVHTPPPALVNKIVTLWSQKVEEKTGGRVKVTIYPSQSLVKLRDMFPGTVKGICDIGFAPLDMDASRYPLNIVVETGFVDWPGGIGPTLIWSELQNKFPEMKKEYEGVKVLWHYVCMPMTLHLTEKDVRVPEDIKGLKIEAAGLKGSAVKIFGASPMVMPPSEWYMALDRGVEDGIIQNFAPIHSLKVHTLLRHHTDVRFGLLAQAIIMNAKKWESLPPDTQKIIDDLRPWIEEMSVKMSDERSKMSEKICKELGHTFITPTAEEKKLWYKAAKPVHDAWIASVEGKGFPGRAIFEETNALIQKHSR